MEEWRGVSDVEWVDRHRMLHCGGKAGQISAGVTLFLHILYSLYQLKSPSDLPHWKLSFPSLVFLTAPSCPGQYFDSK